MQTQRLATVYDSEKFLALLLYQLACLFPIAHVVIKFDNCNPTLRMGRPEQRARDRKKAAKRCRTMDKFLTIHDYDIYKTNDYFIHHYCRYDVHFYLG